MMEINILMKQMIMIINSFPVLGASQGVNDTFVSPYFAPKPRQGLVTHIYFLTICAHEQELAACIQLIRSQRPKAEKTGLSPGNLAS